MVIINWPGSFTQLRVWCISCNILNITNNLEIDFIDIPKLDLFAKAIQQKDIPSLWVIFMGQRKKMRLVDFESSHQKPKIDLVTSEDVLSMIKSRDYFIDRMTWNHPVLEPLDQKNMISELRFIQEKVTFLYAWKTLEIDVTKRWTSKKQLEPRYFMDPQIW